jgi:hypothetical protein
MPPPKKKGNNYRADENKYFESIAKYAYPDLDKGHRLKDKRSNLMKRFKEEYKDKR